MSAKTRRSSGIVVPHSLPWHRRVAAFLIAAFLRICISTWRRRWMESQTDPAVTGPVIYCVWHNRIPVALASADFGKAKWPHDGIAAMISASRDGGLLANIVERFGVQPIRGSSSRRGPQALLEATTWLERNYSVVMTPDGPRGPAYRIQDGIIQLAKLSGRPIIPVSSFTHWKIRLKSWDRLQIPLPFTRCDIIHGDPIWAPRESSDADLEELRAKLERSMHALTRD
ncbi:MAG TPA: lysophospholipid acyltransferase family protein [Candidatus Baltobacteraceae bacterium]|jgi:hypothetical protein|nr:lysophospholipid acyltransferase family protein [Candidatus Baltobacteraceae bacterium]